MPDTTTTIVHKIVIFFDYLQHVSLRILVFVLQSEGTRLKNIEKYVVFKLNHISEITVKEEWYWIIGFYTTYRRVNPITYGMWNGNGFLWRGLMLPSINKLTCFWIAVVTFATIESLWDRVLS